MFFEETLMGILDFGGLSRLSFSEGEGTSEFG